MGGFINKKYIRDILELGCETKYQSYTLSTLDIMTCLVPIQIDSEESFEVTSAPYSQNSLRKQDGILKRFLTNLCLIKYRTNFSHIRYNLTNRHVNQCQLSIGREGRNKIKLYKLIKLRIIAVNE